MAESLKHIMTVTMCVGCEKICWKNMANVGDTVEVKWQLYGDVYEIRNVEITRILIDEAEV